jgi:hypothetical protein
VAGDWRFEQIKVIRSASELWLGKYANGFGVRSARDDPAAWDTLTQVQRNVDAAVIAQRIF